MPQEQNEALSYIDELGIGLDQSDGATEHQENTSEEEQDNDDYSSEHTEDNGSGEQHTETEQDDKYAELKQQVEVMQKRIADKDKYIEELRESSKQATANKETDTEEEEEDFWSAPEKKIKELQDTINLQQMQIMETQYANTVENYWKTVTPEALREAVAKDEDFAKAFNSSSAPYKEAYEYLTTQKSKIENEKNTLKEQLRKELLAEMNIKAPKEAPPVVSGGKSSGGGKIAPEDGFSSVFGGF